MKKMIKPKLSYIVVALLSIVAGIALGYLVATSRMADATDKRLTSIAVDQVWKSVDMAFDAYFNAEPEVAVWALKHYIETLSETDELREEFLTDTTYVDLIIAHCRLANIYSKMGDQELMEHHIQLALSLPNNSDQEYIHFMENRETLLNFIAQADVAQRNRYQKKELTKECHVKSQPPG